MQVKAQVVEGQADTGADVRHEGAVIAEIIVEVGEQGGAVPGAVHAAPVAAPAFFAVAAQGVFQFHTQGHQILGPEVVTGRQGAAQSELGVFVHAAHAGAFDGAGFLNGHQELGSQVHAGTFGLGHAGQDQSHQQGQCKDGAFHCSPPKRCFLQSRACSGG